MANEKWFGYKDSSDTEVWCLYYKDYMDIYIWRLPEPDSEYYLSSPVTGVDCPLETKDFDIAVSKAKIKLAYALEEVSKAIDSFIHDYRKNDCEVKSRVDF